jgi:peptidyl-prolyl cis-trans isomerase C
MRRSILVAIAVLLCACRGETGVDSKGNSRGNARGSKAHQVALAQVDDIVITAADVKEILARYANQPFVLARYSTIEKKKELLDSLIRYDVLAIEARKRGYERDPEVQRVAKDKMVRQFLQREIFDKVKPSDISHAAVQNFYREHATDYTRPESVRASEILVKDRAEALKVWAEAKALPKSDMKAFRELVAKYSEDPDSKPRGGDLTLFDRATTRIPRSVVTAAFVLKDIGDLSEPVETDKGFVVLKLTDRRPALSRSLEDAKPEIQRRLLEELRAKKQREFIEAARKTTKVEIDEDQLAKLDLDGRAATTGDTVAPGFGAALPSLVRRPDIDAAAW